MHFFEQNYQLIQWLLVIGSSLFLFFLSPWAKSKNDFFRGSKKDIEPGFWMLTSSLVISWIFAKSITNAADLGLRFGLVGGLSYAAYYLSFLVAGVIIYFIRVKGKFTSIHDFLNKRFGRNAIILFSVLIAFRLINEVWSNTMVIGSYFGESNSLPYFSAIIVFTGLTLAYTIKGGLRSSLLTDMIQMILFGILLFVILSILLPKENMGMDKILSSGEWTAAGGINFLFVALIQIFSYPFHDPVMTDRAFIADPKKTLKCFIWATVIGFISILLFSFMGIYGSFEGLGVPAPVSVSKLLGVGMMLLVNFIMITSAASTLDSSFNSFSKLLVLDLGLLKSSSISIGRKMIIFCCIVGTIPIFFSPEILSATTISGTMVIGLSPVFLFWFMRPPKISYYLSVGFGIAVGILYTMGFTFDFFNFSGPYAPLLSANVFGFVLSMLLYLLPMLFIKKDLSYAR